MATVTAPPTAAPPTAAPAAPAVKQRPVPQIVNELARVRAQRIAMDKVVQLDYAELVKAQKDWDERQAALNEANKTEQKGWLVSLLKREHNGPRPVYAPDALARATAYHTLHYVIKDLEDELSQYTRSEQNRAVRAGVLAAASMELGIKVADLPPPEETLSSDERAARRSALLAAAGITLTAPAAVAPM
jgi:hypothetical protein